MYMYLPSARPQATAWTAGHPMAIPAGAGRCRPVQAAHAGWHPSRRRPIVDHCPELQCLRRARAPANQAAAMASVERCSGEVRQ